YRVGKGREIVVEQQRSDNLVGIERNGAVGGLSRIVRRRRAIEGGIGAGGVRDGGGIPIGGGIPASAAGEIPRGCVYGRKLHQRQRRDGRRRQQQSPAPRQSLARCARCA